MFSKVFIIFIIFLFCSIGYIELKAYAKGEHIIITINPGAIDPKSQYPVTPRNITVPMGTAITFINKDLVDHQIVSGTPDKGPTNVFYSDFFDTDKKYNITLDTPGIYGYYDPYWTNIQGHITVIALEGNNTNLPNMMKSQQSSNNK